MENQDKDIEIRSEEVQDMLSHVPNWMIRWGTSLIFVLVFLVVFLSWFVKYPDVVKGQVILTTTEPPVKLVSQINGYIEHLQYSNEESVSKGDVIAEIKSPVKKESIDSLLYTLNTFSGRSLIERLNTLTDLGELQHQLNTLLDNLIEYQNIIENDYFKNRLKNLVDQIEYNKKLARITKSEIELLNIEVMNAEDKFNTDSLLFSQGIISKYNFHANQSEYFAKRRQLISAKKGYVQYELASSNYEKQKMELVKTFEDDKRHLASVIVAAKKTMEGAIVNWQQNYVLTATIDGKLSYLDNLAEQNYVHNQDELFAIIPEEKSIVGLIKIQNQAYGKVEVGQRVSMKFDNYPFYEFGQLIGEVKEVSAIPSDEGYIVKVLLENGLTTTYGMEVGYSPEMSGVAEIVTKDLRLIERVFNNLRNFFDA